MRQLERIQAALPGLCITAPRLLHSRHSDVIEANIGAQPYIFKIPKSAGYNLAQEIALLNWLQGRLPLAIPQPQYGSAALGFFAYPKLPGVIARADTIDCDAAAALFAQTLACLHQLDCPVPVQSDPSQHYAARILAALDNLPAPASDLRGHLERLAHEMLAQNAPMQRCLIYNDLHLGNILVDPARGAVTALLDFGFCAQGDPHRDFHQLHKQQPALMAGLLHHYAALCPATTINPARVALLSAVDLAAYYLALAADPDSHAAATQVLIDLRALLCSETA